MYRGNFVLNSLTHDRDINAAKVILKQAGCLLGVERKALARVSARTKLASVKHGIA